MLLLLRSPNRIQAYLLRDILRMQGIKAHVFNEHMSSIVGDVPPEVAYPQLWLDEDSDLERAREVLRAHAVSSRRQGALFCSRCNEENPANFEVCWNCGREL